MLCAIPCVEPVPNTGTPKIACNTIRVFQGRTVDFAFAPAGGIQQGSTGNIISVACKGSCGTIAPNPMDVAIVADRTSSMGQTDVDKLRDGIKGMLQSMTSSQQYVAMGTIGRSGQTTTALAASKACDSTNRGLTYGSSSGSTGLWMPIAFSNDYQTAPGTLKATSTLVKGVECMRNMSNTDQGTSLAAPMKAAAKYLLGLTPNNLGSLPARTPTPRKVLIFETDGQPNERQPTAGDTSLSSGDVFSHPLSTTTPVITAPCRTRPRPRKAERHPTSSGRRPSPTSKTVASTFNGGNNACTNLLAVAANAKAQGILVMMIGYNMIENGQPKRCSDYDGVKDDYSNLNVASPTGQRRHHLDQRDRAGPEAHPGDGTVDCPAPNGTKKCVTIYQTTTTTTKTEASSSRTVLRRAGRGGQPDRRGGRRRRRPERGGLHCSTRAETDDRERRRRLPLLCGERHRHGPDLPDRAVPGLEGHQAAEALAGITVVGECRERHSR